MTPARLVLDTNVLLSALLFHTGRLSWLRGAWRSDRVRPLASRETTLELVRVLACPKFALSAEDRRDLLDDYLPFCETVSFPTRGPAFPNVGTPATGRSWNWRSPAGRTPWSRATPTSWHWRIRSPCPWCLPPRSGGG